MPQINKGERHNITLRIPIEELPLLDEIKELDGFASRGDVLLEAFRAFARERPDRVGHAQLFDMSA